MKRLLNITFSILALLIVVVAIGIGSLVYFIDPNKMRPVIVEEVMNRTGYQLAIYGKLNWRLFPVIGLNVQRMTLTAPDQLEPFVDLRNVTIASELSQLLHGTRRLEGDVRIGSMKFMNMQIENTHVNLEWRNNVLAISPIKAFLYGGSVSGMAHGRELNKVPEWDWNVQFDGAQLQPLLRDLNKGQARLNVDGQGHVEVNAKTKGVGRDEVINNLNGKTTFSVTNGKVKGLDVNYLIQTANALINRQTIPSPTQSTGETDFSAFTGTIDIKNGLATTSNILLTTPAFTTKGEGTINLIYNALNLALQVKPQGQNQVDWEVPILITGTLSSPDAHIDVNEIQRYITKSEFYKAKEKVVNQIQKRVTDDAQKAIQNLLGS